MRESSCGAKDMAKEEQFSTTGTHIPEAISKINNTEKETLKA